MSFGIVFGKLIFGGNGRYLVNPSILALSFLVFSYPGLLFAEGAWIPVPNYDEPTTIELAVDEGGAAVLGSVGYTLSAVFVGFQPGPVGVTSALGCLLGALYLIATGTASWRIMLGSFVGLVFGVVLLNAVGPADEPFWHVPWYWHFVIGGWKCWVCLVGFCLEGVLVGRSFA